MLVPTLKQCRLTILSSNSWTLSWEKNLKLRSFQNCFQWIQLPENMRTAVIVHVIAFCVLGEGGLEHQSCCTLINTTETVVLITNCWRAFSPVLITLKPGASYPSGAFVYLFLSFIFVGRNRITEQFYHRQTRRWLQSQNMRWFLSVSVSECI